MCMLGLTKQKLSSRQLLFIAYIKLQNHHLLSPQVIKHTLNCILLEKLPLLVAVTMSHFSQIIAPSAISFRICWLQITIIWEIRNVCIAAIAIFGNSFIFLSTTQMGEKGNKFTLCTKIALSSFLMDLWSAIYTSGSL